MNRLIVFLPLLLAACTAAAPVPTTAPTTETTLAGSFVAGGSHSLGLTDAPGVGPGFTIADAEAACPPICCVVVAPGSRVAVLLTATQGSHRRYPDAFLDRAGPYQPPR